MELRAARRGRAEARPGLSVFAGGCTLEAAEAVLGADLDTLQSLVDKSLLRRVHERYRMLDTIREYARARLDESGHGEVTRARHADYLLASAVEVGGMHLYEGTQPLAVDRLAQESGTLVPDRVVTRSRQARGRASFRLGAVVLLDAARPGGRWLLEVAVMAGEQERKRGSRGGRAQRARAWRRRPGTGARIEGGAPTTLQGERRHESRCGHARRPGRHGDRQRQLPARASHAGGEPFAPTAGRTRRYRRTLVSIGDLALHEGITIGQRPSFRRRSTISPSVIHVALI